MHTYVTADCASPEPSCVVHLKSVAALFASCLHSCESAAARRFGIFCSLQLISRPCLLTGYITVFLVALVTDRAFLLHQPDDEHSRWEDIYAESHIAWRTEQHLNYSAEQTRDDFVHLDLWCAACTFDAICSQEKPAATLYCSRCTFLEQLAMLCL